MRLGMKHFRMRRGQPKQITFTKRRLTERSWYYCRFELHDPKNRNYPQICYEEANALYKWGLTNCLGPVMMAVNDRGYCAHFFFDREDDAILLVMKNPNATLMGLHDYRSWKKLNS